MNAANADLEVRLAQYETTVEKTAPPPENPARCSCNWCQYGQRISKLHRSAAA